MVCGFLVVKPVSGLGNRIRALVAAQRLARKHGRHLVVQWTLDKYHCWCPYELLFKKPQIIVGDDFVSSLPNLDIYSVQKTPVMVNAKSRNLLVVEENFFWQRDEDGIMWGQFSPYSMRNGVIRDELLGHFASLTPSDQIVEKVNEFAAQHFSGNIIGVHVRRGDNIWSNRYCPDDLFIQHITSAICAKPDSRIFLCTDHEGTEEYLTQVFKDRIFTRPKRQLVCSKPEAIQDAFVELLLLAKTGLIIRSCSSTFSQCASWFGNVQTVDVGIMKEHQW